VGLAFGDEGDDLRGLFFGGTTKGGLEGKNKRF
jgi:hypothetical protein